MTIEGARRDGERTSRFPVDPWRIVERRPDPATAAANETIFALANGHVGLRGDVEEPSGVAQAGTYVNGFYAAAPIVYGEAAYGFARHHQVMLNVADGKRIELHVGDRPVDLSTGTLERYERVLDLRTGLLERSYRWRSPDGPVVEVVARRLVSLVRRELAVIELQVALVEGSAPLRLVSYLDPTVRNQAASADPRVGAHLPENALVVVSRSVHDPAGTGHVVGHVLQRAPSTGQELAVAMAHVVDAGAAVPRMEIDDEGRLSYVVELSETSGHPAPITLSKFLAYVASIDHPEGDLAAHAAGHLVEAADAGFETLATEQREALARFWAASDVEIDGDDALQQGVRYNLFSVFQSAGRDGRTSLAAKGLTGEGYDGHYFWDTEVFALPFFTWTQPAVARSLLAYRHATLPAARARAVELDEDGALFAWRTIGGEEASAYFPAGTAQYHIDADIAHAIDTYVRATGDDRFLFEGGADVVLETARLWASLGAYIPARGGAFCINEVTGPDEYSALVDDNLYTNVMARRHLRFAAALAERLPSIDSAAWASVVERIGLRDEEVAAWRRAADAMRIPYDETLGIHPQDEDFLFLERWEVDAIPPERRPLLLHFHPLVIYRHQILKQPDVVLATVLAPEDFRLADRRRDFAYYDPLTTGDSSLAPSIQAMAAVALGDRELAYDYFMRTARMDLDDVQGNVDHGVHIAAMAGSWFALVHGFAGLRELDGRLAFSPRLPRRWRALRFHLAYRGRRLAVELGHATARLELLAGDPLGVEFPTRTVTLAPGTPVEVDIAPRLACVVFDLDGVITDSAELHYRAWQRLADEEGWPFDRALNERLKGVSRLESLRIIVDAAGATLPDARLRELADRKNGYYRELIETIRPGDLLPGIGVLLDELRAAGIATGLASVSHNARDVVDRLGIGDRLGVIVDPATVTRGKPDPEIFLAAAEALGFRPEDCLGIEDAQAGVDAIGAAGMVAIGVGAGLTRADHVIGSTGELTLAALRRWFDEARRKLES